MKNTIFEASQMATFNYDELRFIFISAIAIIALIGAGLSFRRLTKFGRFANPNKRQKKAHLWLLLNKTSGFMWFPLIPTFALFYLFFLKGVIYLGKIYTSPEGHKEFTPLEYIIAERKLVNLPPFGIFYAFKVLFSRRIYASAELDGDILSILLREYKQ